MKREYLSLLRDHVETNDYYAQVSVTGLKNNLVQKLRAVLTRDGEFKVVKCRYNLARLVLKELRKGDTVLVFSKDRSKLIEHLRESSIECVKFHNAGEVSEMDYVVPRGNLRLKASGNIELFEKYSKIKLTKGMIQLLEPLELLKKGEKISQDKKILIQLLKKKLKCLRSEVTNLGELRGESYSESFLEGVFKTRPESKIPLLVHEIQKKSRHTFLHSIPQRVAQLIHLLSINRPSKFTV